MKTYKTLLTLLVLGSLSLGSCKKFLDEPTDASLAVISSYQDLQALLENLNNVSYKEPGFGEASADNYYMRDVDLAARTQPEQNLYLWEPYNIYNAGASEWSNAYDNVYRANTILDNVDKIDHTGTPQQDWDNIKGQALFVRGKSFYNLLVLYSPAYHEPTADKDLGIVLRLTSALNEPIKRASVKASYQQLLGDLKAAAPLLPVTGLQVVRPSRTAAYALIARAYLSMRVYDSCLVYANKALALKNTLLSFTTLKSTASFPFAPDFSNPEIIYHARMQLPAVFVSNRSKIDTALYASYAANDLRKKIFFTTTSPYTFKGSFTGNAAFWAGYAVNELYLMRAECFARANETEKALTDLNLLLSKRIDPVSFVPVAATNKEDALRVILTERRKELIFSGVRWMDIKRLNKEGANIVLTRLVGGKTYTLPPNDLRYALAIPEKVITLSGIEQNPR